MRKYLMGCLFPGLLMFSGCSGIGDKAASASVIYGVTMSLSLLLLIGYGGFVKKKDPWILLLFSSVLVVNLGFFVLAVSGSLSVALFANRISYLGSVFLPLSIWMIIIRTCRLSYRKWFPAVLLLIGAIVFLIAATPGYLDIYYKEVSLIQVDGVYMLKKVYGPLHCIYLFYLLGYFSAMVSTLVYAIVKKKISSAAYAVVLVVAVFVNIGVWLIEQLVQIDFEMLAISYIISESFLLGAHLFMAEAEKQKAQLLQQLSETAKPQPALEKAEDQRLEMFRAGLASLTPKEKTLYECYVAGMTTAEIMDQLNIKENTLKFHNKNLYSKLGVSSRKQLLEIARNL